MREIKFRAWDKEEKEMIDNVVPFFNSDGALECLVFGYSFGGYDFVEVELDRYEHIFTDPEFDERFVLMQYTGLKDRNGVEIYENDNFRFGGRNYVVMYNLGSFGCFEDDKYFPLGEIFYRNGEVVGDIYKNQELLEREME